MYVNTSTGVIERSAAVPKEISCTQHVYFRLIPNALRVKGVMKSAIQCGDIGGYASNRGGIILPTAYTADMLNSVQIQEKNGQYFVTIEGREYNYSVIYDIGNRNGGYWLIDDGNHIRYYSESDIGKESIVFNKVPSGVFHKLLTEYPAIKPGSKSSFLLHLFRLCQEGISQQDATSQEHMYSASERGVFNSGAQAMQTVTEDIIALLKQ